MTNEEALEKAREFGNETYRLSMQGPSDELVNLRAEWEEFTTKFFDQPDLHVDLWVAYTNAVQNSHEKNGAIAS